MEAAGFALHYGSIEQGSRLDRSALKRRMCEIVLPQVVPVEVSHASITPDQVTAIVTAVALELGADPEWKAVDASIIDAAAAQQRGELEDLTKQGTVVPLTESNIGKGIAEALDALAPQFGIELVDSELAAPAA